MNSYLDRRTIGRWPARTIIQGDDRFPMDRRHDEEPFFLFFDGKSFTPHSTRRGNSADLFTGYGVSAATLRPGKLAQNDWDFARAYVLCEYAFRCIEMVASDVSAIKHGVRNKQTKEDIPDHPLMKALRWAKRANYQDILSLWQKSLYIWGEAYLLPVSNGNHDLFTGRPFYSGLQWLNPLVTEPYIPFNRLEGFDYTAYGVERFRVDEIVYDKVTSVFDDIRGQSRMSVALAAVNIDVEIKRYTLDSFLKDMRWAGILTGRAGSGITQPELDAALASLKERRESRLVALAPALEYQKVQNDFGDAQFKASDDARRRITTALGIPMSVVGAWDDAKYQSAPAQLGFYYDHVIFRECDRLTEFINEVVMPYFDPAGEGEWYYDKDSVSTLIEDKAAKVTIVNMQVEGGYRDLHSAAIAAGVANPPDTLKDLYMIGGVPVPLAELPNYWKWRQLASTSAENTELIAGQLLEPTEETPMLTAGDIDPTKDAPVGGKSACLMLTLPNNPDLITLQQHVQRLYGTTTVTWNAPESFHITLLYAPSVTDEQIAAMAEALEDVDVPELSLNVGSLKVFKNPGENAVVFLIRRNPDLYDYQEMLYELFVQLGIPMSSYSLPDQYQPHITIGYSTEAVQGATYKSKLRVKPVALRLSVGDEVVYERAVGEDADDDDDVEVDEPEETPQPDALDELKAWRKFVANNGAAKAGRFVCYKLPGDIEATIREGLTPELDKSGIKALFDDAEVALKARTDADVLEEDGFLELVNVWGELGLDWLIGEGENGSSDQSQSE